MYGKIVTAIATAVLVVGLVPTATATHTPSTIMYVGGGYVPGAGGTVLCQSPPSAAPLPFGVGGGCDLTCPGEGRYCNIRVLDSLLGPWGFFWRCGDGSGGGQAPSGFASVPNTCAGKHYDVFVYAGATTGTISLSKSDFPQL